MQTKNFSYPMDLDAYKQCAEALADASGMVIRRYYRTPVAVDNKEDTSPVTIADREAEQTIRVMVRQTYPDHGVVGEEFGASNPSAEYQWVIDPIDGTKSFLIGRPIFGTLIALTHQGTPLLGVIDQPIAGERWVGVAGQGTWLNGKLVKTRACASVEEAVVCTTGPQYFPENKWNAFQQVATKARYTVYGGDCYSYALLAMGLVDIVIETGLKPHDFCALVPVVTNAGGVLVDWEGKELTLQSEGSVIALGDKHLLPQVQKLLRQM